MLLMTVSKSLTALSLSNSNISGTISMLSAGLINSEISQLTLDSCSLNDKDLSELAVAVSHPDCKLTYLSITGNNFSPSKFTAFLNTLFSSRLEILIYDKKLNVAQENILCSINQHRITIGKPPLKVNESNRYDVKDYEGWKEAKSTLPLDFLLGQN